MDALVGRTCAYFKILLVDSSAPSNGPPTGDGTAFASGVNASKTEIRCSSLIFIASSLITERARKMVKDMSCTEVVSLQESTR
jgi:hypothetical protein